MKTNMDGQRRSVSSSGGMRTKGTNASALGDLFLQQLRDIYWAEKALVKAIPKMIKKTTNEELVSALEDHLAVTEEQVSRVEEVFASIEIRAQAKECAAMKGLIEEAEELMEENEEGIVRD